MNYLHKTETVITSFSVKERGLYWIYLSAGVPENSGTYCRIINTHAPVVIFSDATTYPSGCLGTTSIQWINSTMNLSVSNNQPVFSSENAETSWLGFRLDNKFEPLIAFNAQLTFTMTFSEPEKVIPFDRIVTNEGKAFLAHRNVFIAPLAGLYFITLVTTSHAHVSINNKICLCVCVCDISDSSKVIQSRGSVIVELKAFDELVASSSLSERKAFSNSDGLISLQTFLYSPSNMKVVSWSVSLISHYGLAFSGPQDYLNYSVVNANVGDPWKATENKVVIPVAGIYFVDLSSHLCGYFWNGGGDDSEIEVVLNSKSILINRLSSPKITGCITRSKSVLVNLNIGDIMRVRIPKRGRFFQGSKPQNSFNGFLLA